MKPFLPVVLGALIAGCLGGTPSGDVAVDPALDLDALSWADLGALVFSDSHEHANRSAHLEVARNITFLNFSNFNPDGPDSLGEYTEADVENGIVAIAVTTGAGVDVRVVLLDEAALPDLRVLGTIDEPRAYGDVKLDDELPLVYIPYPSPVRTTSPRPLEPANPGFSIWDISDPATPRRVGEAPGVGCHTLHPMHVAQVAYVWCAAPDGAQTYRIEATALGYRGVPLLPAQPVRDREVLRYNDYYTAITPAGMALAAGNHDMTAQRDPLTGDPVLVVANELNGIRVFDVSLPAAPRELSAWRGEGLSVPMDRVHSVGLVDVGGMRVGIGLTETFSKVRPSAYLVDFTDYANPKLLVHWSPPGIPTDERLVYSMHNFQVVGTRLYMTNFHAGLWVVDIADPAAPQVVALRTPVRESGYPRPTEQVLQDVFMDQNWYWDVVVASGYVILTDMSTGVEVVRVEGDAVGDPALRGFA